MARFAFEPVAAVKRATPCVPRPNGLARYCTLASNNLRKLLILLWRRGWDSFPAIRATSTILGRFETLNPPKTLEI